MYDWSDDDSTKFGSILTSCVIAGAMTGAMGCGPLINKLGKLKLFHVMNVVLCVGIAICMVNNIPVICVGRFIWGISFGCFSVISAKYNNEICPIEYKGPFGAISQLLLTFGVCIPSLMSLAIPSLDIVDGVCLNKDEWLIDQYWRIIWLVPVGVAVLHTLLLLFCFNHETPAHLREHGEEEKLLTVMKKFYHPNEIKARLAALAASDNEGGAGEVSYYDTFFDPSIRRAAWVGIGLASFQQLTGINAIIFFSATLFSDPDFATKGVCIINVANFVSTGIGMGLLYVAGRKTLMVVLQVFVIAAMFGMWYFAPHSDDPPGYNQTINLIFAIGFICAFEFGPGPIVWLYISEICNDKATSVGTVVNWFWTLVVSVLAPFLINDWLTDGKTWLLFGSLSIVGLLFIIFFMKETRGKSEEEVKRLFRKDDMAKMPIH